MVSWCTQDSCIAVYKAACHIDYQVVISEEMSDRWPSVMAKFRLSGVERDWGSLVVPRTKGEQPRGVEMDFGPLFAPSDTWKQFIWVK